jgi:hypothetical protein
LTPAETCSDLREITDEITDDRGGLYEAGYPCVPTLRIGMVGRSAEFSGEPNEKPLGPADVAGPLCVFVLDNFAADKLRAVLSEPGERLVDVVHGEHHA